MGWESFRVDDRSPHGLADGLAAVLVGDREMWRRAEADGIGLAVALRLGRPTVTNSPVAVRPWVIGGRSVVYIAVCGDSAGVRVDVAFVGVIIPHGVVWTASIVRLHNSPVASRVTVNILLGECRWIKNNNTNYKKHCK
jgi:hypothetical protein